MSPILRTNTKNFYTYLFLDFKFILISLFYTYLLLILCTHLFLYSANVYTNTHTD